MGVALPRAQVGVRNSLKSLVTGPSSLVNYYLGNKFHKKNQFNAVVQTLTSTNYQGSIVRG